mmetsp:Transcript_97488/g.281294  ORF Transcript_97488/g.281294 Transcript_97488/m.281294 type:complete len:244 (+) Transcript_97488:1447-2178(+)
MLALHFLLLQLRELAAELALQLLEHRDHLRGLRLVGGDGHVREEGEVGILALQQRRGRRRHLPGALVVLALQRVEGLGDGLHGLREVLAHGQVALLLGRPLRLGRLGVRGDRGDLLVVTLDLQLQAVGLRLRLHEVGAEERVLVLHLLKALLLLGRHIGAELLERRILHLLLVFLLLGLADHALQQVNHLLHGGGLLLHLQRRPQAREEPHANQASAPHGEHRRLHLLQNMRGLGHSSRRVAT